MTWGSWFWLAVFAACALNVLWRVACWLYNRAPVVDDELDFSREADALKSGSRWFSTDDATRRGR